MTATRSTLTTSIIAAALVVVTGCSSSGGGKPTDNPTSSPPSTSSSASDSPSSSSPPATPSEVAATQAEAFVPTYLAELDKLYLDPTKPLNDIYQVATGDDARTEIVGIGKFRSQNYRQTGSSVLVHVTAGKVDLANNPKANPPKYPSVSITACVDVGGVGAVDAKGKSIVPPNRKKYLISTLTIVNIKYPSNASWRVSAAPNRQADSCSG